ncbi:MAG: hypothetical protein ACE5JB_01290 [bacterium]
MDSNIQLIGSIVIGSIFLLGVLSFYGGVFDFSHEKTFELLTQETIASLMEIIEHDFQKIGSGLPFPAMAITDSNTITFLGDIDEDGVVDTVRYSLSDTLAASSTPNPNDVILYRDVNSIRTIDTPAGVTAFTVTLLDEFGNPTTELMDIRRLNVSLTVESLFLYDGRYARAVWQESFAPINLYKKTFTNF